MLLPFNGDGKTGEEVKLGLGKLGFIILEVLIINLG